MLEEQREYGPGRCRAAQTGQRRALLAVLCLCGLRISEALDLTWSDVRLADGRLRVHGTKTDVAFMTVNLLPVVHDELAAYKARAASTDPAARVFATSTGARQSETNVRRRILAPAVEAADVVLAAGGHEPIGHVTPHGLRRTFASVLAALGEPMPSTIRQLGHTDPGLTLRLYAHDMARSGDDRARLRALVEGDFRRISGVCTSADDREPIAAPGS